MVHHDGHDVVLEQAPHAGEVDDQREEDAGHQVEDHQVAQHTLALLRSGA